MKAINFSFLFILALSASTVANAAGSMLRVTCEGDDVGAEVLLNGKFKGECPVDISIKEGAYKLRVEKNDPLYERVYEQDIRMGDGVVKKVEAVLSKRLNAEGQRREAERLAAEQAEVAKRKADEIQKRSALTSKIEDNMIPIPNKNYAMGKYEVTQAEWQAVMGSNPSNFTSCGDTCPVEGVSWDDIQTFLQKLNQKTGRQYRLPNEEEWEYACYGGSKTEYCGGSNIDSVAWYKDNSNGTTHPVGQKQANGYGLYDMSGNVWEWQQDWYDNSQKQRALRGGSWGNIPQNVRAANRSSDVPTYRCLSSGFRLARTLP